MQISLNLYFEAKLDHSINMENVTNDRQQRDHVELDLRVDDNDAIFSNDDHENENPRRVPRDHSRERDGDHDHEDSNGRDPLREGDDRRANP